MTIKMEKKNPKVVIKIQMTLLGVPVLEEAREGGSITVNEKSF